MTDREFKRLSRPQLIEIIYQLQVREEELMAENNKLKEQLEDKRVRMEQAGNIAEAILGIHGVMQSAQDAAQQYIDEVRTMRDETQAECDKQRRQTQAECEEQVQQARQKGENLIRRAIALIGINESVLDVFLRESKEDAGEQT